MFDTLICLKHIVGAKIMRNVILCHVEILLSCTIHSQQEKLAGTTLVGFVFSDSHCLICLYRVQEAPSSLLVYHFSANDCLELWMTALLTSHCHSNSQFTADIQSVCVLCDQLYATSPLPSHYFTVERPSQ